MALPVEFRQVHPQEFSRRSHPPIESRLSQSQTADREKYSGRHGPMHDGYKDPGHALKCRGVGDLFLSSYTGRCQDNAPAFSSCNAVSRPILDEAPVLGDNACVFPDLIINLRVHQS